jgi:hypothetical protein
VPAGARLAILVVVGIAAYVPLCLWRARDVVDDVRSVVASRRRRASAVALGPVGF